MPSAEPAGGRARRPLVVGLGGSMRRASCALRALGAAIQGAADAGAETRLLDIRELALPILPVDHPVEETGDVHTLLSVVRQADGLIISSPVYQDTVSGALKNTLDYLGALEHEEPPGLAGKVVGVISVAGGESRAGASLAVQLACRGLGAWVLPDPVDLDGACFDHDGLLCDLLARDRLRALGRQVATSAGAGPAAGPAAVAGAGEVSERPDAGEPSLVSTGS